MRKVKAPGNRVLIKLKPAEKTKEEVSSGGLILKIKTDRQLQLEQEAIYLGYVVDIGPDAYAEYKRPWCKIGDCVQISKYSGVLVDEVEPDYIYRMVNDIDVLVVFPEEGINE